MSAFGNSRLTADPLADKVLLTVILLFVFASLLLMAFDAVRFRWSFVPSWVQAIGALRLLVAVWLSYRTMRENSFAVPVVKITTGPYRYGRHPFYTGAIVFLVGTTLLLGSLWGLVAVPILAILLGIRIRIEEKALRNGLHGYDDYAERVRYRLVPLVW
jgi:protein-S-isoprenylcysteine O-methyltransferase Ste14